MLGQLPFTAKLNKTVLVNNNFFVFLNLEFLVPEAPIAVKALVMSTDSILVSWKPPVEPNGIVEYYTVYYKPVSTDDKTEVKPTSQKIVPNLRNQNLSHQAKNLDSNLKYEFWVTAATTIGEGQPSKKVTVSPSSSGTLPLSL